MNTGSANNGLDLSLSLHYNNLERCPGQTISDDAGRGPPAAADEDSMTEKEEGEGEDRIVSLSQIAERLRALIHARVESGEYDGLGNRSMDEVDAPVDLGKPLQE